MATNSQLSTTGSKKQTKQTTRTGRESQTMEIIWRVINRKRQGENGGNSAGNKQHKWQVENRQGDVKNSIGNGEAKELMCTTHGHELRGRIAGGNGGTRQRRSKGEKNWVNCHSIINKIFFFKKRSHKELKVVCPMYDTGPVLLMYFLLIFTRHQ